MGSELLPESPVGKGPVILIVDDDDAMRLQISLSLENDGFHVVGVATGLAALAYFRSNPVELILLDVVMPGIDGFLTCREIRSLPDGVHLPVVMMTGLDDAATITEAMDAGATDFITKPVNLLILCHRVRYWLRSGAVLQALQVNQTRLIKAQEIAGLGHWELSLETGQFQLTCHNAEIFGLRQPCAYEDLFAPITSQERQEVRQLIDDACRYGRPFSTQYRITLADGSERTLFNRGEIACKGASNSKYLTGIIQDITKQQKAEESLLKSEKKWRAVFERSPMGIALFDNATTVLDCNAHFTKIFGVDRPRYLGVNLLLNLPPGGLRDCLQKVLADGHPQHYQGSHTSFFSGKEVYIHVVGERISPDLIIAVVVDFTEQRQAILAQEELQEKLNQAQKIEAIGRLAGGVAHDFNNMLGVILGRAEMALEQLPEGHVLGEDLQEIRIAAQRSADLTGQLLTFARKQTVAPQVLDLNRTVAGFLKMVQRLIGENITLLWQPGENLRSLKIDPNQVHQILANLCVNARDAISGNGTITVGTQHAPLDPSLLALQGTDGVDEYLLLTVSDNGCGFDETIRQNLFEPFFTTKEMGKGTGLGLATVYGIVKQNAGFINVLSRPGQGTTFRIFLPPYTQKEPPESAKEQIALVHEGSETILVVEDEPTILTMMRTMLLRLGYQVLTAGGPGEALRRAAKYGSKIHLLLTDVVMPEMNGRDLAAQLQAVYPDLKILFMSGYTAEVIATQEILQEGLAFIQKPFTRSDLSQKLREILGS